MPQIQQTFANEQDVPIYISIEPWPKCYELEPGETLTLRFDVPEHGDALRVNFINSRELVIWPEGKIDAIKILINGQSSKGRSWNFKHR